MRLVLDANVIFAALIRDSVTRKILFHPKFEFFVPDFVFDEITKNISIITKKTGLSEMEILTLLDTLKDNIITFSHSFYKLKIKEANKIIGKYDKNDIPYIALALSIENNGIWTNDKHFLKQNKIRIWSTQDLLNLVE